MEFRIGKQVEQDFLSFSPKFFQYFMIFQTGGMELQKLIEYGKNLGGNDRKYLISIFVQSITQLDAARGIL